MKKFTYIIVFAISFSLLSACLYTTSVPAEEPEDCETFCTDGYATDAEVEACIAGCAWAVLSFVGDMMDDSLGGSESHLSTFEDGSCLYESDTLSMVFMCPENTDTQEDPSDGSLLFLSPARIVDGDIFAENVNIMFEDISAYGEMSLQDYIDASKETIGAYIDNVEFSKEEMAEINGIPAMNIVYTGTMNIGGIDYFLKWEQFIVIHNYTAIIFTYTCDPESYDDYRVLITTITDSLELL